MPATYFKRLLDSVLAELLLGGQGILNHADVNLQDEVRVFGGQADQGAGFVPEYVSGKRNRSSRLSRKELN